MHSVFIIDNPLMDYVVHEGAAWLERFGAEPGSMRNVGHDRFLEVVSSPQGYKILPGGSGANTARALAILLREDTLGEDTPGEDTPGGSRLDTVGRVAYSGAVGDDEPGKRFILALESLGIDLGLAVKPGTTGVSAVVVTPDHETTMFTCVGASRDFGPEDLRRDFLRDSRFLYSTGFVWDAERTTSALEAAVEEARAGGSRICFDLADLFVVQKYKDALRNWIRGRVDVLFANREELSLITECEGSDPEIIRRAERLAPVVAMKIGKGGCLILGGGRLAHVPAERVARIDATAAGDSFAAGFLYGLATDRSLVDCGRLANRLASRVLTVEGARYELLDRSELLI